MASNILSVIIIVICILGIYALISQIFSERQKPKRLKKIYIKIGLIGIGVIIIIKKATDIF
ncbi:MAG: hypothetical protein JWR72_750 [Flavisolibacter sp.]|jgi:hypothetical protein|nr:hypothetical protein [Flavisolibacter sp.]